MKKIFIDAGHGGTNPGATYGKRKESEDVFALAQAVADRLSAVPGVAVKLSRTADTDPELDARTKEANAWGADYFISIHRNAFMPNKASGIEAWICSKAAINGDAYRKAQRIVDSLSTVTRLKNRGVKLGAPSYTDFGVNRLTKMHSCLLEVGFVDNSADNAVFDSRLDAMALALAKSLCRAVGVEYKEQAQTVPGDVDGNGTVDVNDARTVLRAAVGLEKLSPDAEKRADTDGDGKVTVNDARDILRTATGLDK